MSVELISVLIAVLAIGATLAGLILTSNRGPSSSTHRELRFVDRAQVRIMNRSRSSPSTACACSSHRPSSPP